MAFDHVYGACPNQEETNALAPKLDDPKLRLLFYEHVYSSHHFSFSSGIRSRLPYQLYSWHLRLLRVAAGNSRGHYQNESDKQKPLLNQAPGGVRLLLQLFHRVVACFNRPLDVFLCVRQGNKHAFKLRWRNHDAFVQQMAEVRGKTL